jgi:hypothetical protein
MSVLFHVACRTGVRFSHLVAMRPTLTIFVCCFGRLLALPCRFDLVLQCRNLVLELRD